MTPAGRRWLKPATTLVALTGILLAGAAAGSAPVDRPDPPGTTTEVRLGIFVMDVASIDDANQTFTADFFLILRWTDPRLAFAEPAGCSSATIRWDRGSASPPPPSSP